MPTPKPNLTDYKGETFNLDPDTVALAMERAKGSGVGWVWFIGALHPDKKQEVDRLIDGEWGWYNEDMSLRNKPKYFNDADFGENDDDDNEPSPVVAKNATTEPQRMRAVDRLKARK